MCNKEVLWDYVEEGTLFAYHLPGRMWYIQPCEEPNKYKHWEGIEWAYQDGNHTEVLFKHRYVCFHACQDATEDRIHKYMDDTDELEE